MFVHDVDILKVLKVLLLLENVLNNKFYDFLNFINEMCVFSCCRAMPFCTRIFFSPWCLSTVVCSSMHTRSIRENFA